MAVTTDMIFSSGVTSSNFNTIKNEMTKAIAIALGVEISSVELTFKRSISRRRRNSIVVVVSITSTDEDEVGDIEYDIKSNSFVAAVNTEFSKSTTLLSAGVELDSVTATTSVDTSGRQYLRTGTAQ